MEAVKEADFLMVYRAGLTESLLRTASKVRLVQLLAAGYDRMNLELMGELGIPCANNGGANSWAVADHTVLADACSLQTSHPERPGHTRGPLESPHWTGSTPLKWLASWLAWWESATSA